MKNEYYDYSRDFERELECEMEKWNCGYKTPEVLHNIKELMETITLCQEKEAGEAMREYLEDEYGYDSRTGDFRERMKYNPYGVYNMAGPVVRTGGNGNSKARRDDSYRGDDNRRYDMRESRERDYMRDYDGSDRDMRTRGRDGRYTSDMYGVYNHGDEKRMKEKKDKLSEQDIKRWMDSMESINGERGPMWTKQEVEAVAKKDGITFDKFDLDTLYAAMNMMYSDYCEVGEKFNVDKPGFYLALAKNFLVDPDFHGGEDEGAKKLALYYHDVVKE